MKNKKVVIIGAGPAGMTAAYKLAQNGCEVEVYEAGAQVGGLARSFELWGQTVDCGPHRFFSNDKIVNDFFMEVVEKDFYQVNRLTRIYYNNKFYYYPLSIFNVLANMGPVGVTRILGSYFLQRLRPLSNPQTFEDWIVNKFGRRLFDIFFKNYSEKLWGIPCSRIDADWAAQRIKKFSLMAALKTALVGDKKQVHKTLVDQFIYPSKGAGMVYQKMLQKIEAWGGKVFLNAPVEKVLLDENNNAKGIKLADGTEVQANEVISTMPLTLMVKGLRGVPEKVTKACESLFYRNTILVYVEVNSDNLFPDNWIYIHSAEVKHGRITNFRNWSPDLYGDSKSTILCLEYWCFDNDEIWSKEKDYFAPLAESELRKLKLLFPGSKILNTEVVKLRRCYPVYETGYAEHIQTIKEYLDKIGKLRVIGRYGAFKYNNQDHSILMGLLAAREILLGTNESLWNINTDSEYHETGEAFKKE